MIGDTQYTVIEADWTDTIINEYDFSPGVFEPGIPLELAENRRWLTVDFGRKNPSAPWGDPAAPAECNSDKCPANTADDPACECDARNKWGYHGHYLTGQEVLRAAQSYDVEHLAYIFSESDPYLFVDMDDVRCPETGRVHPVALAFLAVMGAVWIEISQSGTGLHAVYRGELPDGTRTKEPVLQIDDEPWGANDDDDLPEIELYPTKQIMVTTEMQIPGTPTEVRSFDADALEAILDAHGELTSRKRGDNDLTVSDLLDDDDDVGFNGGVTSDVSDLFASVDALNARRVGDETIVAEWLNEDDPYRNFRPVWASSDYDGTAVFCTRDIFKDKGNIGGKGGPVCMAAIDCGELSGYDESTVPRDMGKFRDNADDYFTAFAHLRGDCGCNDACSFDIPIYSEDSTELYLDVIGKFAASGSNPYQDPDACLLACLSARESGEVPSDAEPLTLAVHAIVRHLWGVAADSHAIDETNLDIARNVFADLDVETACSEFELDAAEFLSGGGDGSV